MEPVVISIEGSIGAGKSTLIQKLKERFNKVTFLTEPLKYYTSFKYHNPLTNLYVTPFTDSSVVQDFIIKNSFNYYKKNILDTKTENIIVTDRSFDSVDYFIKLYLNCGYITPESAKFLNKTYIQLKKHFNFKKIFVFLDVKPKICKRNIINRNRTSEEYIDLHLLSQLEESIEEFKKNLSEKYYILKVEEQDTPDIVFEKFCNLLGWTVKA